MISPKKIPKTKIKIITGKELDSKEKAEFIVAKSSDKDRWIIENKKANLIYYPTFDSKSAKTMQTTILSVKHVLFNKCDIPCPPWDTTCPAEKEKLIDIMKDNFKIVHHAKQEECEYYIFTAS